MRINLLNLIESAKRPSILAIEARLPGRELRRHGFQGPGLTVDALVA